MLLPSNYGDFGPQGAQAPRKEQVPSRPVQAPRQVRAVASQPVAQNMGAVLQRLMRLEQRVAKSEAQVHQLQRVLQALLSRARATGVRATPSRPTGSSAGRPPEEVLEPEVMPSEPGQGISPEEAAQAIEDAQYGEPDGSDEFEAMINGDDEEVEDDPR